VKVKLTSDQLGKNPDFDPKYLVDKETNPVNRIVPAGTELEGDHELLYLIINGQAEPVDDKAKQAWQRHLDKKKKAEQAKQKLGLKTRKPIAVKPAAGSTTPTPGTQSLGDLKK
tara:strand:- start:10229 stop:10570 length:342 start_codon:yes stop_codon:yes gene_type:complete